MGNISLLPSADTVQEHIRKEMEFRPDHIENYGPLLIARDLSTAPRNVMDDRWFQNLLTRCLKVMTEEQRFSILVACYAGQRCVREGTQLDGDFQSLIRLIEKMIRGELGQDSAAAMLEGEIFGEASAMASADGFPSLCVIVEDCRGLCSACIRECPRAVRLD